MSEIFHFFKGISRANPYTLCLMCLADLWSPLKRRASLVAQMVKNLPAMLETWVRSLGGEDPLEEGMATPIPVFWPGESPWTEFPGRLQSIGVVKSQTQLSDQVQEDSPVTRAIDYVWKGNFTWGGDLTFKRIASPFPTTWLFASVSKFYLMLWTKIHCILEPKRIKNLVKK